jgi:hypothetical protein
MDLTIGTRVTLRDAYLDAELTKPVTGTIVFRRPDWSGATAYVVKFDQSEPWLPPGGEFPASRLEAVPA